MKRLLSLVFCLISFNAFSGIDEGRAWLESKAQTDGGVYQPQEIALPVQATGESVKLSPSLLIDIASAQNYLKAQVTISNRTEFIARAITSGLTTDGNTQSLTSRLLLSLNRDGGFGSHQFGDSNAYDTAWALLALSVVNPNHESISPALFYLNGSVNSDGGWGYPDDESSIFVSALVLNAISNFRHQFDLAGLINPLESYLLTSRSNGLWSEDFVSAQVLIALQRSLPDAVGISESVTALRARQLTNGSWSNDVYTTALALQALGVTADVPVATQTGVIIGLVLDGLTENPLQGATVSVAGIVNKNVVTASDGQFSLPDLPAGSYQLAVSLNGYNNVSGSTQLSAGQRADFGTIRLNQGENPTTATIYGQVSDFETGLPLSGASILLQGPGLSVTTNADGAYQLSGVAPETLTVNITRSGYSSATSTLGLSAGGLYVISPALTPAATQTTALQGTVVDGNTGLPLVAASVVISGSDADSVESGTDGSYFIGDINPGNLNVIVSLAGYDSVLATATLFQNNILQFSPKLFPTNTAPPNNSDATVSGIVVDSTTNLPLAGVSVFATFGSQTLSVLSAEDGSFSVEGLSELQGSVQFSLTGFNSASYGLNLDPLSIFSLGQVRLNPVGASELLSDLTVNLIDNAVVTTDPETLQVSGDLLVNIGNTGTAPATAGVEVTAFYDIDKNDIYNQNTDTLLATGTTISDLAVGGSEQIILSLQGELPYRDALIKVWVDSLQTTVELNELNNIGNTADYCGLDITDIEMPFVYYGRNVGEENPNPQNSALNVVGVQNETIYTVTDLTTNNVVFSGVINRLETIEIALEGVHLFKFESNKPAQILVHGIYLSVDQTYGSYFYLDDNGQDYYGHRFTFFAHLGRANDHYVFAKSDSRVEVRDESSVVISTVDLLANQHWRIPNINAEQVHTIVSTGEIAVESVTYNSFSVIPPVSSINCIDNCISSKGNRFFFGTRGDRVGDGAAAITNTSPIEVVYTLTRMSDGFVFRDEVALLPEARHYIPGLGTSAFSLEVTGGDAIVLAGSTERGQGIEHIGDDLSPLLLEANEEVSLNTQTAGIIIFSAYDNTQIQFGNGSVVTLNRDEFFSVGPFQETTFSTTNSSIVLLAGGTCCEVFNDWGSTLRAIVKRPLSDLTLSSLQFSSQAIVGNQLSVKAGNSRQDIFESQSTVSFFEGDPDTGGTLLGTVDVPAIPSDSYQDVTLQDVVLTGGVDIYAVVDYENIIQECNELNNSMFISAPDFVPDLTISFVDDNLLNTDLSTLDVSGSLNVDVSNQGISSTLNGFELLAFFDANTNEIFDAGIDTVLGNGSVSGSLGSGNSINVVIPITGNIPFRDAPILVLVDNSNIIVESDEDNNINTTAQSCAIVPSQDEFITDPETTKTWLGAGVGTFAQLFLGSDTPETRQQIIDNKMLVDGIFDPTGAVPATLISAGGSGGCLGASVGGGGFGYNCASGADVGVYANQIDNLWFQTSGTVGQTVFDLGFNFTKVAVFNSIDHGPLPQEAIESTIYLSNDQISWTQAVTERVWLEGFIFNEVYDGFSYTVGTGTGESFRYVSVTHGGPGSLINDGDNEINGLLGLQDNLTQGQADLTASRLELIDNGLGQTNSLRVRIGNGGAAPSPDGLTVDFYSGDPQAGGALIGSVVVNSLAASNYRDVQLDNVSLPANTTEIFAIVDSNNLVDECDESNNQVSIPIPSSQLAQLQVGTDSLVYGANDPILLSGVVTNTSNLSGDFSVSLQVEDLNGVVVTQFNNLPAGTLTSGATNQLNQSWASTNIVAATYQLRGSVFNTAGDVLDTALSQFEIRHTAIGTAAITLRTRTDKPEYNTTDTVQLENLVRNITGNTLVDGAFLNVSVLDPNGTEIFNQVFNLNNLGPNGIDQTFSALALATALQGNYSVQGEVLDAIGNSLATDSTSFAVAQDQRVALIGNVTAQFAQIQVGDAQLCTDQITNQGNDGTTDYFVRQVLTNISTQTDISLNTQAINIASGSGSTLNHTIDTQNLIHGFYACALQVDVNGEWVTLDADSFEVLNRSPIANTGAYQGLVSGTMVTLDGSQSTDPDGDALTYQWTLISAPVTSASVLQNSTDVNPSLLLDVRGDFEIQLTVSDGELSDTSSVIVEGLNNIPVANAGNDQMAIVGNVVTLDGSASTDIDGDNLIYQWQLVQLPANSISTLSDTSAVMPTITIDEQGTYLIELIVNDGIDSSVADTVMLTINNIKPVSNAGADQSGFINDTIILDGSNSSDVDGDALTYLWSIVTAPENSNASLSDFTNVMPTLILDGHGNYQLQLIVNDGFENSDPDFVTISTLNSKPVSDAGADQAVFVNDIIDLTGLGSFDADGDVLTYQWSLISQPANSSTVLFGSTTDSPSIEIDVAGVYVIQLMVNDGLEDSDPDTIVLTTQNVRPVAEAGSPQLVDINEIVALDGSGSNDPDGDIITYLWSVTSQPNGSNVGFDDSSSATPQFTPLIEGSYVMQLSVNDGNLASDPDTVTITVENPIPPLNCSAADVFPNELWPPNHKFQEITVQGLASDTIIRVTAITQDEPIGKGKHSPDAKITQGGAGKSDRVYIRREREGKLRNGRVYQIQFDASNPLSGDCSGSVNVAVPHDQSHPIVDDGQLYNSLGQ